MQKQAQDLAGRLTRALSRPVAEIRRLYGEIAYLAMKKALLSLMRQQAIRFYKLMKAQKLEAEVFSLA